jgi:type I restriction enzyme S subunit
MPIAGRQYRQIGVRLWGEGAYERELLEGAETKYSKLNRVMAGDIIVNKIWARNGSVAVVPPELEGCYCSAEFPVFAALSEKLDRAWFHWLTKTAWFWAACEEKSRGTSGKNRIRPERFLEIEIPLPVISEQRRLSSKISQLLQQVSLTSTLMCDNDAEMNMLCRSLLREAQTARVPMHRLLRLRAPDVIVDRTQTYSFAGVYSFGRGVFKSVSKSGMEFAYERLTSLHAGNFVYPKLMAWEGALGVVPIDCDGLVVSPEFPVFIVNADQVLPETLDVYFRSPSVWPELFSISTGTNVRRRRLHPSAFLDYQMPLPPMSEQLRLRQVRAAADKVQHLRREAAAMFGALQTSILAKAFIGEL